mmetsp:Transcript_10292/g.15719  ORF Transcript_10292/g.15719 Transcript_10292/m.15719 type:complete len:415 (-) Transcript_10292:831-2075(-)
MQVGKLGLSEAHNEGSETHLRTLDDALLYSSQVLVHAHRQHVFYCLPLVVNVGILEGFAVDQTLFLLLLEVLDMLLVPLLEHVLGELLLRLHGRVLLWYLFHFFFFTHWSLWRAREEVLILEQVTVFTGAHLGQFLFFESVHQVLKAEGHRRGAFFELGVHLAGHLLFQLRNYVKADLKQLGAVVPLDFAGGALYRLEAALLGIELVLNLLMEVEKEDGNASDVRVLSPSEQAGPDGEGFLKVLVSCLEVSALLNVVLSHLFEDGRHWQTQRTYQVAPDGQSRFIVLESPTPEPELLVDHPHVHVAVSHAKAVCAQLFATDVVRLDEAGQALLELLLLVVVDAHHEVSVASLHAVFGEEVLHEPHVLDVDLLALFLVAHTIKEASNNPEGGEVPLEVVEVDLSLPLHFAQPVAR